MPFDGNYGLFWDAEPIHRRARRARARRGRELLAVAAGLDRRATGRAGKGARCVYLHAQRQSGGLCEALVRARSPRHDADRARLCLVRPLHCNRFLDQYDTVVTNGPALTKRLAARGIRVDATMPLGIERAHFSPDLRDERCAPRCCAQCGLPPEAQSAARRRPPSSRKALADGDRRGAADRHAGAGRARHPRPGDGYQDARTAYRRQSAHPPVPSGLRPAAAGDDHGELPTPISTAAAPRRSGWSPSEALACGHAADRARRRRLPPRSPIRCSPKSMRSATRTAAPTRSSGCWRATARSCAAPPAWRRAKVPQRRGTCRRSGGALCRGDRGARRVRKRA